MLFIIGLTIFTRLNTHTQKILVLLYPLTSEINIERFDYQHLHTIKFKELYINRNLHGDKFWTNKNNRIIRIAVEYLVFKDFLLFF